MHVAMSASIKGAGIWAGYPYGCASNTAEIALACSLDPNQGDISVLYDLAKGLADEGKIDDLANLAGSKAYVQCGESDTTVV